MAGELADETVLITGATDGLGHALAKKVAAAGARTLLHGRSAERAAQVSAEIIEEVGNDRVEVFLADFAELRQVERLAEAVRHRGRLDVLVNNAGVGFGAEQRRQESADGIELRFAVNYLASYLLTTKLLSLFTESGPARIINVASAGQQPLDFDDPMLSTGYTGTRAYAQSKLAMIMFTFDMSERLRDAGVRVNALHPATFMDTSMVRQAGIAPVNTVDEGLAATFRLVADRDGAGITGQYFDGMNPARALEQAYDRDARARLRTLSNELIERATGANPG